MRIPASWTQTEGGTALVLSLIAVLLGALGPIVAFILFNLIMLFTNVSFYGQWSFMVRYPPAHLAPWMIVVPAVGGLVVGLMVRFTTVRIRGHGIPETIEAVLTKESRVDWVVAVLKPLSAAIAVGTGGPFGAEGPIIQTGGAIGSLLGQILPVGPTERRTLLACGAAAGMVGIFNTPITAVALVLELLLFEFRARSLIPVVIASAVASAGRAYLLGSSPLFAMPSVPPIPPLSLLWFIPLGILLGTAAVVVSRGLYAFEELFDSVFSVPSVLAPAVGGLCLGLLGYIEPAVLGMGYPISREILATRLTDVSVLPLGVGKTLALWIALGSGTSGGLLAPMLMIGAALGSAYGQLVGTLIPALPVDPSTCAIVGMSALFGSAARIPLTSFLFAFELTGDYHAILPLMIGGMVADLTARLLSTHSVMTEKLVRRGVFVPLHRGLSVLTYLPVRALMQTDFRRVRGDVPARELLSSLTQTNERPDLLPGLSRPPPTWWIVENPDGTTLGVVTWNRLARARLSLECLRTPVSQLAEPLTVVVEPTEIARVALDRMLRRRLDWLPVVQPGVPRRVVGYVTLRDLVAAERTDLQEEAWREGIIRPGVFPEAAVVAQRLAEGEPPELD